MKNSGKMAILALGFITLTATAAMAPSLTAIQKYFFTASPLLIKLIITLPALVCIPISLLNNKAVKIISKKNLIIIGLIFFSIGGLSSSITNNIYLLLFTRLILGLGLGITAPMSLVLIGDFFEGIERDKFMGYSTAGSNIGAIIATLLVGTLSSINWRFSFLIYIFAIIVLIIVILFLPNDNCNKIEDSEIKAIEHIKSEVKLNKSVFKYAVIVALGLIAFYALPTNMAFLVKSKNFGSDTLAANLVSLSTFASLISSIFFAKIMKKLGKHYSIILFISLTIGFTLLGLSENLLITILGTLFTGFAFGGIIPYGVSFASNVVHKSHTAFAIIIVTVCVYLGEFISPIVLQGISNILHLNPTVGSFFSAAIISIIAIIISLYTNITYKKAI
ncbi:MAG: MFS transporter [Sarcina sp.]